MNRRITVLQTVALPLGYAAVKAPEPRQVKTEHPELPPHSVTRSLSFV